MRRSYGKFLLIVLVMFLSTKSSANAATQFFAGPWHESGGSSASIGIVQNGETVAIFGKAGWAMAFLEPHAGGMLALGEGKWTFDVNTSPVAVNVTIGYRSEHIFLLVVPKDGNSSGIYKVIMRRVEPVLSNRKT